MPQLLIGCGNRRERLLRWGGRAATFDDLVTMDHDPDCGADVVHDLECAPWPVEADSFDEVHAYEVLEHLGTQGDYRAFFAHFGEIWRVLKPGGFLAATVPAWDSEWAWGDPSHRRVIAPGTLLFLSQDEYRARVGRTPMTDFRWLWPHDFRIAFSEVRNGTHAFLLEAIK